MLPIRLDGEACIRIGTQVFIGPNSWLQAMKNDPKHDGPIIHIGDRCGISGFCTITAAQEVRIEQSVLIARYVYISDHVHAHSSRASPIRDQGLTGIRPVRICEGAWLGQSVVVCPGVTIGRGAVVGANSVVREDVPEYTVAAGVPARSIRYVDQKKTREKDLP